MEIPIEILDYIWVKAVAWFTATSSLMALLRKHIQSFEKDLSGEARKDIAQKISQFRHTDPDIWLPNFIEIFDRLFGKKHLTLRCFVISSLISFIFYLVGSILLLGFKSLIEFDGIVFIIVLGIVVNCTGDYFSLLETRIILNKKIKIHLKISIDVILTIIIAYLWTFFVICVMALVALMTNKTPISSVIKWSFEEVLFTEAMLLVLLTAFSTSVWLWLHGISFYIARLLRVSNFLLNWFDVENKPLTAISNVMNTLILGFSVLIFPLVIFWPR